MEQVSIDTMQILEDEGLLVLKRSLNESVRNVKNNPRNIPTRRNGINFLLQHLTDKPVKNCVGIQAE